MVLYFSSHFYLTNVRDFKPSLEVTVKTERMQKKYRRNIVMKLHVFISPCWMYLSHIYDLI